VSSMVKQLYVADREQWRDWLSKNHATKAGIWLIFYKKETSKPSIAYDKKRANKMIKQGKMTKIGLAKIETAKKTGLWEKDGRPQISFDIPPEFAKALARNKRAKENFDKLAPTYRKHYIGWIAVAKRPETKKRRIEESIALLEKGQKLGLK
jgi:uncharacterized protein YdeI (YjbR/CyaY-like superfamily)